MSERLKDSLRVGVIHFVRDENDSSNGTYENIQAIVRDEGDYAPILGHPLKENVSALFLYIDQILHGYDSYFLKLKMPNFKKDSVIFGRNYYSSLHAPRKGRLSIMMTKSIDKEEYPVMISGEEFHFLDDLLGFIMINGGFAWEKNDLVGQFCYFDWKKKGYPKTEADGKQNVLEFLSNADYKPLFEKNRVFLERSDLKMDSCWNIYLFAQRTSENIFSRKYVNGKDKDFYDNNFKNWENFDSFDYLSLFANAFSMFSQNEYVLRHLAVNDRIVFFSKFKIKEEYLIGNTYCDDDQEKEPIINILMEVSNRINNEHNNLIKGFERKFLDDLNVELEEYFKQNGYFNKNAADEFKCVDVNACPTTNKEFLDSNREIFIKKASENKPSDEPPINIKEAPIVPLFVKDKKILGNIEIVKDGDSDNKICNIDKNWEVLGNNLGKIIGSLMKKYFP